MIWEGANSSSGVAYNGKAAVVKCIASLASDGLIASINTVLGRILQVVRLVMLDHNHLSSHVVISHK